MSKETVGKITNLHPVMQQALEPFAPKEEYTELELIQLLKWLIVKADDIFCDYENIESLAKCDDNIKDWRAEVEKAGVKL